MVSGCEGSENNVPLLHEQESRILFGRLDSIKLIEPSFAHYETLTFQAKQHETLLLLLRAKEHKSCLLWAKQSETFWLLCCEESENNVPPRHEHKKFHTLWGT